MKRNEMRHNGVYDVLIVITPKDYLRVRSNFDRILSLSGAERIVFCGSTEIEKMLSEERWSDKAEFLNEDDILPFENVSKIFCDILSAPSVPRGLVGWYYQQFLKMEYSKFSRNKHYLVWDGDTVPTKAFSMFDSLTGKPVFDMKYENHEEYFITMQNLLGFGKVVKKSFISEHMIFDKDIMSDLISTIESKNDIRGDKFYEKILYSIREGELQSNSFSEFETYGSFVCLNYPDAYIMKDWHSIRYGSVYFKPEELVEEDYSWLGVDFDAVSFEKGMEYNPDIAALFTNPEYREKLTARQIIEAIQDSSSEGMREEWEDSAQTNEMEEVFDESPDVSIGDEFLFYNYLGDNLINTNPNQAYLCYENAEFLAQDFGIKEVLRKKKTDLLVSGKVTVNRASIVILSYNSKYLLQNCIASIKKYCAPGAYAIVVVDNASTDGVREWLMKRKDITLVLPDENLGFPKGCNEGIRNANSSDDIFLLNNDTRMTHNALFWLRMGLYEDNTVGATGCVSNYCGLDQRVNVQFDLPSGYVDYASKLNVFLENPYEEKSRLCGFAMLMKREAFDKVGALEEALSPGYYEDDDICAGIRNNGYKLLICHNSFIYHAGSQSFNKRDDLNAIFERNHKFLTEKWGYDILTYAVITEAEENTLKLIGKSKDEQFRVLEVGSGSGNFLSRIKYLYPLASVYGVESNPTVIKNGIETIPNLLLDWKKDKLPFPDGYFDYIIVNRRDSNEETEKLAEELLSGYLKKTGKIAVTR